jgi:phenylalanyl-tRNA synthetase beta subunit
MVAPYNPDRSGFIWNGKMPAGVVGEYRPEVIKNLKLPIGSAGFEVFLSAINTGYINSYHSLPRFPSVYQDITLKTSSETNYSELHEIVDKALVANAPDDTYIQLEPLAIYQKQDDPSNKQTSFRVSITAENRTLTDKEISRVLDSIATEADQKINAVRI